MRSSTTILAFALLIMSCLAVDCPPGFDLVPPKSPLGICVVVGCSNPVKDQICSTSCLQGYTKTTTGFCQVIKCSSKSRTTCTVCEDGYQLQASTSNPTLRVCTPINCQQYDRSLRTCNKCQIGYKLNLNGTCSIVNCLQSRAGQSVCTKCKQGFVLANYLNFDVCLPNNCVTVSNTTYQCLQCQTSSVKTTDGYCKLGLEYCTKFNQFSGLCYQCQSGYQLVAFKICVKQNPLCFRYGEEGCTECRVRYRARKGTCQANFCDQLDPTTPTKCKKCEPGYIVNSEGLCTVQNCKTFDQRLWRCTQCNNFYTLNSVTSASTPGFTVQRCLTAFCQRFDRLQLSCLNCGDQYTLSNGTCTFSNCDRIGERGCQLCVDGWVQNQFGNCVNYDCYQFVSNRKCSSCLQGKRLYKDMCVTDYCLLRSSKDNSCAQCPTGMDLIDNNFCIFPFCKSADQSTGECLECYATYKLNSKGNCQSFVCLEYQPNNNSNIGANCTKCADGYEPNGTNCIPSRKYCANYSFIQGKCQKCADGYEFNSNKTICIPQKCLTSLLASTYSICKRCSVGYRLLQLGDNVQKCQLNNCTTNQGPSCKRCVDRFMLIFDVCLADNCKTYNDAGFCTVCNLGFYLNQTGSVCLRERCVQDSPSTCNRCDPQFYADTTKKGICRPFNCDNVQYQQRVTLPNKSSIGGIRCLKCVTGFTFMPKMEMCVTENCNDINPVNGLCRDCMSGFSLQDNGTCSLVKNNGFCQEGRYPNINYICEPIKAKNCVSANPYNTNQCYKCQNEYFLRQGQCRNFTNCKQKNPYLGCIRCELGYQPSPKTGECQGTIANCKIFDKNTGQCQQCFPSYQITVYPVKACKLVPDWCALLDMWGNCQTCNLPNRKLNSDKKCILETPKCTEYQESNGFCSKCDKLFYLQTDQQPPVCKPNPQNCLQTEGKICTKCDDMTVLIDGTCYRQITNCISYQKQNCIRCLPQYYVSMNQQECKEIPRFCQKIILNTDGICDQCRKGFTNVDGICIRNIQFCVSYTQDGKCQACQEGYSVSSTRSICLLGFI